MLDSACRPSRWQQRLLAGNPESLMLPHRPAPGFLLAGYRGRSHLKRIRRLLAGEVVDGEAGIRLRGGPFDGKI